METEMDFQEVLAKGGMRAVVALIEGSRQVQENIGEEGLRKWVAASMDVMPRETQVELVTFILAKILNAFEVDVDMDGKNGEEREEQK